jgi:hypothetical protein
MGEVDDEGAHGAGRYTGPRRCLYVPIVTSD